MPEPLILQRLRAEGPNSAAQVKFFEATARHVGYGGARAGGKSWAMRRKFVMLAIHYPGLKLLMLRRTLPELRENHILILRTELFGYAKYNDDEKAFSFPNGSRLKLGYCDAEADVLQYLGQEYDVIGLEEATGFSEFQRNSLVLSCRSTRTDFTPRMYYTTNPGGVGHAWFKRLFIDRIYQNRERAEDYVFIPATVYDNPAIMQNNPDYVRELENQPEEIKRAYLYGDWSVFLGQYFTEFRRDIHVVKPFEIPADWRRYFVHDYGLDMWAGYWIAMDSRGRAWVYREKYMSGLRVSQVADEIAAEEERRQERIYERVAPPDLFSRNDQTGRSPAEIWAEWGLPFNRSKNDRVQGWYDLKEWLAVYEDEQSTKEAPVYTSNILIFDTCVNLIRCIPLLQRDSDGDPNDCAKQPHELTHSVDALRYFVTGRPMATKASAGTAARARWEDDMWEDYDRADEAGRARLIERWGDPF